LDEKLWVESKSALFVLAREIGAGAMSLETNFVIKISVSRTKTA